MSWVDLAGELSKLSHTLSKFVVLLKTSKSCSVCWCLQINSITPMITCDNCCQKTQRVTTPQEEQPDERLCAHVQLDQPTDRPTLRSVEPCRCELKVACSLTSCFCTLQMTKVQAPTWHFWKRSLLTVWPVDVPLWHRSAELYTFLSTSH